MINRIEQLIEALGVTQKEFANQIGVSTATLSHVSSGRNKPSLDLVMAILQKHPNVNTDWLLFGRGNMVKMQHEDVVDSKPKEIVKVEYRDQPKPVDHIVIFYDDNTYCTFYPK